MFRKLKDYQIDLDDRTRLEIIPFRECEFKYQTEDGYKSCVITGFNYGQFDFLLEYYVKGILPAYKIVKDKIIPYLIVTLDKEINND